jgi:hypothetical protein
MKYVGLDHVECECNGLYAFKIDAVSTERFALRYMRLQPSMVVGPGFHPITAAMEVVASCPPYLRLQDCPWILAYMDDLRDFYDSKYGESTSLDSSRTHSYFGLKDKINEFSMESDIVSLTRMMYVLDIVRNILFGGQILQHDYFTSDNDLSWLDLQYHLGHVDLDTIDVALYRRLDLPYDKSFKTTMTRNVFKGAQVMITIPEGEELATLGHSNKAMILTAGAVFECTVVRFYKTDLCWANRATFEFYPTMNGKCRDRLTDEPLFAVEMDMAKEVQGRLRGATINAFIPLHWISHVYHNGQFLEVGLHPTPKKSESKLPVPMTVRDFPQFSSFLR